MAMCAGAHAATYGFVDGDRVSVIISDTPPADTRYVLFKKHLPAQVTAMEPGPYSGHILAAAKETRVDPALIHAVISVESGYNPSARSTYRETAAYVPRVLQLYRKYRPAS